VTEPAPESTTAVKRVAVRHPDAESFAPYGVLVRAGAPDGPDLNRAPGQMAFLWVHRSLSYPAEPFLATSRYYYRGARCEYMQRHPQSTTVLIPLGYPHTSVIILAHDDGRGRPDPDRAEAFCLDGTFGVVVHPNTWIRYAYPITPFADFAYVSSRVDAETDIERFSLENELNVVLEFAFTAPDGPGVALTPGGAVTGLPSRTSELGS
jgi:ureidoglycolate hydrolase